MSFVLLRQSETIILLNNYVILNSLNYRVDERRINEIYQHVLPKIVSISMGN